MTRRLSLLLLVGCVCALGIARGATRNVPFPSAEATTSSAADSLLLDQYPGAYAAYSLRKLRSDYSGPVVRVRRSSDGAEQDFGFTSEGNLDITAIESWLSGDDGVVVEWYSQIDGHPSLTPASTDPPQIAQGGTVHTDENGNPKLYFSGSGDSALTVGGLPTPIDQQDFAVLMVVEHLNNEKMWSMGGLGSRVYLQSNQAWGTEASGSDSYNMSGFQATQDRNVLALTSGAAGQGGRVYQDAGEIASTTSYLTSGTNGGFRVGAGRSEQLFEGYVSEVVVYHYLDTDQKYWDRYSNINSYWTVGPLDFNKGALLPQQTDWQVTLYDWMETLSVEDVTLPDGTLTYDNSYSTEDELADLWLQVEGLTASSVTRAEPEWYTLDAGNGKGIEATGVVRANHDPKGGGYGGNPPRSWQNEPAFWYQLDLPLSGGGQGNPWYQDPAMGRRAMAVAMTDMMMHVAAIPNGGSYSWYDMIGKAFLGMAEAYRWVGEMLPAKVQDAYEDGLERIVDHLTSRGPRAVNTNMDMFAQKGAAELYMATDDAGLKQKCVEMVKKALLGYKDGALGTNHKVFKAGEGRDGGVFDPSGFIMEGDQPDIFYGGESIYQLMGALQTVTDRSDGSVPSEWGFLEEVVRRLQRWRTYQMFYDPKMNSPAVGGLREEPFATAGTGFSGRTSADVPSGQASEPWKQFSIAHRNQNDAFKAKGSVPSVSDMESDIANKLSTMDTKMSSNYTAEQPNEWAGWSPWTKPTPYLPPEGWYSELKTLKQNNNPDFETFPHNRSGNTFNKTFGGGAENKNGDPIGKEYWSYLDEDANGNRWGFFVEAQKYQGGYGGWYGGKIETFWTEETGVLLINRHGKTGCDRSGVDDYSGNEDSGCWFNLDEKAGHHVWGRDENGNGFTTLLLRGRNLSRTSTFDEPDNPTTVAVNNVFNDPNGMAGDGEQTGSEIEGQLEVENKFEVQSNGLKVTHTLTSDETDDVNELWASLPVYLRHNNPYRAGDNRHANMNDTRIEYWDGSGWVELPFDTDSDEVPEIVSTDALRLGRDYEDGQGMRYAYVSLPSTQDLRRSKHKYYDPYQSKTGVRTVHIDLHGDPGTTKTLPASRSVSYTIQTTEPALGALFTEQDVSLRKGSNLISAALAPEHAHMDSVFADVAADVVEVKNEAGERYRPADGVNEIGHWDRDEAYVVYAESGVTLSLQGTPVDTSSITLDEGWNWVPYPRSSELAVEEALTSIQDVLVMVKDETGRAYVPGEGIEELSTLTPGEGYRVYVSSSTTLTYPAGSN